MLVDIFFENLCKSFGKGSCSKEFHVHVTIHIMAFEVLVLFIQGHSDFDFVVDVLLRSVLDSHIA